MAEKPSGPGMTRFTHLVVRVTSRFNQDGHQWHQHIFEHAHADGDGQHRHGNLLVNDELVAELTRLLAQVSVPGTQVSDQLAEQARAAAALLRNEG